MPYQTLHVDDDHHAAHQGLEQHRFERNTKAFTAGTILALVAAVAMAALLSFF